MIEYINGDIFKGEWDVFCHCANLYNTWGSGIVIPLRRLYPESFHADLKTINGDDSKLGTFSYADIGSKRIYNLYGQIGIGNNGNPLDRNCQYDKIYDAMYLACCHLTNNPTVEDRNHVFALPMIGCGLAGGKWPVVRGIVEAISEDFKNINFHIYQL
jgi:O-acetyl-ADP-ribose deacetylase (regulator of RNase III)